MLAREVERLAGEATLDHGERLLEARDAQARPVVRQTQRVVVDGHPPGADAQLHPAVGQQVDRRRLLGDHGRVLVVVAEHEVSDAQRRRRLGGHRDGDHRCERRPDEVIGREQRRVAQILHLARAVAPFDRRRRARALDTEAELAIVSHVVSSSLGPESGAGQPCHDRRELVEVLGADDVVGHVPTFAAPLERLDHRLDGADEAHR